MFDNTCYWQVHTHLIYCSP